MKSNRLFFAPLATALLLIPSSAFAQPNALMPTAKTELAPLDAANWRAIQMKNVPPSMVAWQLDPAHNKMPAYFNLPPTPLGKSRAGVPQKQVPAETLEQGVFALPGIARLAAADEQNLLFVTGGNAQQLAQLQEFVSLLDQPLRQVEIEAQMVELPAAELQQFGIDFSKSRGDFDAATAGAASQPVPGAFQIGFVRNDFQKRLNDLIADNKAKVTSTKPQTTTNNMGLAVSLRSGPIDNTGANQNKPFAAPADGTDTVVTFIPTINGDNTITVLMRTTNLPAIGEESGLTTIANVRDGDTIALGGLRASVFPSATNNFKVPLLGDIPIGAGLFRSKKIGDDERVVLVFVTARILRADEN